MAGTVIITGANGSLGLGFVKSLLASHPEYTLVATVRNPSGEQDPNTAQLLKLLAKHPKSQTHLETLNLGRLADVRAFTSRITDQIAVNKLPRISAIVCNAFTWSLSGQKTTADNYEATFQVSHLSHMLLVLGLLGSMDAQNGRIVMVGAEPHDPERGSPLSKLRAAIPDDLEHLVRPPPDAQGEVYDLGFQRYGTAKLANVVFMHDLNARLLRHARLSSITVTCMDPGGLVGSRAHSEQKAGIRWAFGVINVMMPLFRHLNSAVRTTADAGQDLVALSVGPEFKDKRGYFVGQKEGVSAEVSRNPEIQKKLWDACWAWTGLSGDETALGNDADGLGVNGK
ncbi:uncharacterized protein B0H64DRAFT_50998 [Chaetomium fimeti]|uniref:3beta-hydroxysteroid 3-dehydrogenase n=1 Tax=Chaetomium fimeti TaxID=1854472 RepID=A0AAE0H6T3_9PEZI|nr:hypothetical protein B0H64DRAFT_50998 [Chaetomium fimeti]